MMIGFGIIGCGAIAVVHAEAIASIQGAKLIACCDVNSEKGQQFAEQHHCRFYNSYLDLLEDEMIEVVTIATPHYLHAEMSVAALRAGKHVICEKPMALNVAEAEKVLAVAHQSASVYAVCYQNRFNPTMIHLKKLLMQHHFGALQGAQGVLTWHRDANYYSQTNWKGKWALEGGGVLMNQAIHTLDALCWLIGTPEQVKGKIMTTLLDQTIEVEDTAMAMAKLNDGTPVAVFATNDYVADPAPTITLQFEHDEVKVTADSLMINGRNAMVDFQQTNVGKAYWGRGHRRLFQAVIAKVKKQPDALIDYLASDDALASLRFVQGIYRSSQTNSWQLLNEIAGGKNDKK